MQELHYLLQSMDAVVLGPDLTAYYQYWLLNIIFVYE